MRVNERYKDSHWPTAAAQMHLPPPPALSATFSREISPSRAVCRGAAGLSCPAAQLWQAAEATPADPCTLWGDNGRHQGHFSSTLRGLLPVSLSFSQLPAWIKSTVFFSKTLKWHLYIQVTSPWRKEILTKLLDCVSHPVVSDSWQPHGP